MPGPPPQTAITIPAGNYLPGVPLRYYYGEARWSPVGPGFSTALDVRYCDRIFTTDSNAEWADHYTVIDWRMMSEQRAGRWRINEFLRVDNLMGKGYIGSVIVGDTNRRYFEPAPGRNYTVGVSASLQF